MPANSMPPQPHPTPTGQLEVTVDAAPPCFTVTLHGEVDLATTPQLTEALDAASRESPVGIVLDLARCTFMDSSGLALLERAAQKNGSAPRVFLARAQGQVLRTLEISGLDGLLPTFASVAEAREAVTRDAGRAAAA
jgi:anti-sigma B factor antagonist